MSVPDPAAYQAIVRHGRPALAWEVLRRDPAYRAAYAGMPASRDAGAAAGADFLAQWGLHFP
jgi:hypothetical protein